MKHLLYILPLALVVCFACGESHKSSECGDNERERERERIGWSHEPLYGDVKEAKVYCYHDVNEYCGEYYPEGDYSYYVYKFNSNGDVSTSKYYDKYGDLNSQSEYFYDSSSRLIRETYTSYGYSNVKNEAKYTYDTNGNCEKEERYENGVLQSRMLYTYDDNGNCIERFSYDGNGRLLGRNVTTFDNQNRQIESYTYDHNNKFESAYIREYDNNDIYEYYKGPKGQMYLSHVYNKDIDGKEIERGYYNSDGELTSVNTYEYDSNGNLTSRTETSLVGYNNASYTVYKYDDLNNIVSEYRRSISESYESIVFFEFEIIF